MLAKRRLSGKTSTLFLRHNFNDFMEKEPFTKFCGVFTSPHEWTYNMLLVAYMTNFGTLGWCLFVLWWWRTKQKSLLWPQVAYKEDDEMAIPNSRDYNRYRMISSLRQLRVCYEMGQHLKKSKNKMIKLFWKWSHFICTISS